MIVLTAKTGAETALAGARQSAQDASDVLERNKEVAVRTPYVGSNGNWFVWNNTNSAYEDSGTQAQGIQVQRRSVRLLRRLLRLPHHFRWSSPP